MRLDLQGRPGDLRLLLRGPARARRLQRTCSATSQRRKARARSAAAGRVRGSSRSFAGALDGRHHGLRTSEPQASHRADVCRFADDRLSVAARLAFVHELLRRDAAEVRMFLDRLEKETALTPEERAQPEAAAQLAAIAADARRAPALLRTVRRRGRSRDAPQDAASRGTAGLADTPSSTRPPRCAPSPRSSSASAPAPPTSIPSAGLRLTSPSTPPRCVAPSRPAQADARGRAPRCSPAWATPRRKSAS